MTTWFRESLVIAAILSAGFFAVLALSSPVDAGAQEKEKEAAADKGKADKNEKGKGKDKDKGPRIKVNIKVKHDGSPVSGATVLVQRGRYKVMSSTNSQGVATFSDLRAGQYHVEVTATGYKPHKENPEFTNPNSSLEIPLQRDGSASNRPQANGAALIAMATIPSDAALRHFPAAW